MLRFRFLTAAIIAAVAALASPATSQADFKLRLDYGNNGSYEAEVVDNGAGDSDSRTGFIVYSGGGGGFSVVFTLASSKPILAPGVMDMLNLTISGAGTVAIEVTDTGFTPARPAGYEFSVGGTSTDRAGLRFRAGGTSSNAEFDLSTSTGDLSVTNGTGTSFTAGGFFGPGIADPYSLTMRAVITHDSAADSTSFDAEVRPVPAPGGLILAVTCIPFFGLLRRRLQQPAPATV